MQHVELVQRREVDQRADLGRREGPADPSTVRPRQANRGPSRMSSAGQRFLEADRHSCPRGGDELEEAGQAAGHADGSRARSLTPDRPTVSA